MPRLINVTEEMIQDFKTISIKEVAEKYKIAESSVSRLKAKHLNINIVKRNKKEVPRQEFLVNRINNSININGINIETPTKEIWISLDKGKLNVRW